MGTSRREFVGGISAFLVSLGFILCDLEAAPVKKAPPPHETRVQRVMRERAENVKTLPQPQNEIQNHPIKVIGDKHFVQEINNALNLIKTQPEYYKLVTDYIMVIRQEKNINKAGMAAYAKMPTAYYADSWVTEKFDIAGGLVHEACHSKLYNDYKTENNGNEPPDDVWTGRKVEKFCIETQISFLTKVKAPKYITDHYEKILADGLDPKHWSNKTRLTLAKESK